MGTSSSYGGRKDRNPLIPRDYAGGDNLFPTPGGDMPPPAPDNSNDPKEPDISKDDDKKSPKKDDSSKNTEKSKTPIKHEAPWKDAKTSFSRHIKGSNNKGFNKTMHAYGRASGSTKVIISSSRGGIHAGNALGQFLTNNVQGSDDLSKRIRDIFSSKSDIKTTFSLLANALSPSPDDKESSVARDAVTNAMCHLYEYIEKNNLDISIVQKMDYDLQNYTLGIYLTEYIWGRMLNEFQSRIEEKIFEQNRANEVECEFREYIKNKVDVEIRKTRNVDNNHNKINVVRIYKSCCEVLFYEKS